MEQQLDNNTQHLPFNQTLYRIIAGIGIAAALVHKFGLAPIPSTLMGVLTIIVYLSVSFIVLRYYAEGDHYKTAARILGYLDALLIGVFVSIISFNLLPMLIFITLVQVNALTAGGIRKWLEDNLALALGVLATLSLKQPNLGTELDFSTNVVTLLAFAAYLCLYGYHSHAKNRKLKDQVAQAEAQQIQLKLRNYRLSKYLSPTLRKAIQSGKTVKLETQRKKLTVFFSDIKGFSELAEEMDADFLTEVLNSYLTEMSEIALKFGATIDKFIGDAIMVFYGDPVSKGPKTDAVACVSMAIAMQKHMKELQLRWINQGISKPLQVRMGINSGFCTVGNFGTENRLDYTLLGTEVNLASRLESVAEPGEILVSAETHALIKDQIMCRDKGQVKVKGFQDPVQVYSVVDLRKNMGKDQSYFEHATDGFSLYLDIDRIKNYDKDKILLALENASKRLKSKNIV